MLFNLDHKCAYILRLLERRGEWQLVQPLTTTWLIWSTWRMQECHHFLFGSHVPSCIYSQEVRFEPSSSETHRCTCVFHNFCVGSLLLSLSHPSFHQTVWHLVFSTFHSDSSQLLFSSVHFEGLEAVLPRDSAPLLSHANVACSDRAAARNEQSWEHSVPCPGPRDSITRSLWGKDGRYQRTK